MSRTSQMYADVRINFVDMWFDKNNQESWPTPLQGIPFISHKNA